MQVLSDDYAKVAFLCADRSIALHAKFGAYHKIRIPRFGRDLAYHPYNADLLVAGSSSEIFRCAFKNTEKQGLCPTNHLWRGLTAAYTIKIAVGCAVDLPVYLS